MTVFLIIIVVALFGITVWQLTKIFQLSRDNSSIDSTQISNNKDNRTQGNLMLAFGIGFYLFMLYCFWFYSDRALPASSSEHGSEYDTLMFISLAVIMFVQIITQGLLHWFSYRYKGRKGQKALFFADNDKLEFIWTIIPVIVLAGLIIYGLFTWSSIMNIDEDEGNPLVIEIYAKQFAWEARYAGADNTLGKANVRFIEGINTVGIDVSDSYAMDDKVTAELRLPVGRPVIFKFRSQDVLHSAYFPHFRAQMNVVPGMTTQFAFTPTVTTKEIRETEYMTDKVAKIKELRKKRSDAGELDMADYEEFDYYLLCNKICGTAHYNMQMRIIVETEEEFNTWLAGQREFGEVLEAQRAQEQQSQPQQPAAPVQNNDEAGDNVAQVQN